MDEAVDFLGSAKVFSPLTFVRNFWRPIFRLGSKALPDVASDELMTLHSQYLRNRQWIIFNPPPRARGICVVSST